jgi:hypothetical protein
MSNVEYKPMPHPLLKDMYLISNQGFAINKKTGKVRKHSLSHNGYRLLACKVGGRSGKYVTVRLARMVAIAFIDNPENKPEVNHIDGDKLNDGISNLEWVTGGENRKHAFATGLADNSKGYQSKCSGLTEEQARYVEKVYKPHDKEFGTRALGRKLGVAHTTIQNHIKRIKEFS